MSIKFQESSNTCHFLRKRRLRKQLTFLRLLTWRDFFHISKMYFKIKRNKLQRLKENHLLHLCIFCPWSSTEILHVYCNHILGRSLYWMRLRERDINYAWHPNTAANKFKSLCLVLVFCCCFFFFKIVFTHKQWSPFFRFLRHKLGKEVPEFFLIVDNGEMRHPWSLSNRKITVKTNGNLTTGIRGCEWFFKNSGSRKILVEFHGSRSLVFWAVMCVSQSRFLYEGVKHLSLGLAI